MANLAPKVAGRLAYPYGRVSGDEEVLAAALNALHHSSGVPHERLRVAVRRGRVVLSGVVNADFERSLAEQVVRGAAGVAEVANEITLES